MATPHFYFASCVLPLLLTLSWRTSSGNPLHTLSAETCARCSTLFQSLLLNTKGLYNSDVLCFSIPSDQVALSSKSETLQACAPNLAENSGCVVQRNSPFSESECLMNIMKDLAHYEAAIKSYLGSTLRSKEEETALLTTTLGIIKSLREDCTLTPDDRNDSSEADNVPVWGDNSYSNRQKMCKMMRGFYVRAITINRAMGYISSGDHRN